MGDRNGVLDNPFDPTNPVPTKTVREYLLKKFEFYAKERLKKEPHWLAKLKGKNLACFCKNDEPCHADILLRLAKG